MQICQIELSINTAEHVVHGHVVVEVEGVKQSVLLAAALSHHAGVLPSLLLEFRTSKTRHCSIVFQQNRSIRDGRQRMGCPPAVTGQKRPTGFLRCLPKSGRCVDQNVIGAFSAIVL